MADFTATWTWPAHTTTGTFILAERQFVGDKSVSEYSMTGEFDVATAGYYEGDATLPRWEFAGEFIGGNNWAVDIRWGFDNAGEFTAGNIFTGAWEWPAYSKTGAFYSPVWTGAWTWPALYMDGRFEPAIAGVFRAWPMNVKNRALTEYEAFPFNSFAAFNGETLAAGAGGIFTLSGEDDAGEFVDARVRLALTDFGVEELKRAEEVFLTARSPGTLTVSVVVDGGQTYEYPLEPTGKAGMYTVRVKVGRGLRLTHWCFEIANFEGVAFDLDALRLRPIVLKRRIGGQ